MGLRSTFTTMVTAASATAESVRRSGRRDRPSLLAVTSELPWPLDCGGHLRTFHLLRALSRRFDVRLVAAAASPAIPDIRALEQAGVTVVPVAVGRRRWWREVARALRAAAARQPYAMYLRHHWQPVRNALRRELQRTPPDVLYLDHLDSLLYSDLARTLPIVVDLHNVYSALIRRESTARCSPLTRVYLAREARLMERAERFAARTAHALLTVSTEDESYFRGLGAVNVHVVPNGVDFPSYAALHSSRPDGPPIILYLGAMSWEPNVAAARFLAHEALPRVREAVPDAQLQIVGKNPTREARALGRLEGVEVIGRVADVRPYLDAAHVLAVPLEVGGGTRLKILEAFAAGLPVVSTPVGCEGLEVKHLEHLWISSRRDFADGLRTVLTDKALGGFLASRARPLAWRVYDWSIVGDAAWTAVASAIASARKAAGAAT